MLQKFRLFFGHRKVERLCFCEACFWIVFYEIIRRIQSPENVKKLLGRSGGKIEPDALTERDRVRAKRIGWAVEATGRHLPWHPVCLPQALAAKRMLHRHGLSSAIYLGIRSPSDGQFTLHVWLKCGNNTLTGGKISHRFELLEIYN